MTNVIASSLAELRKKRIEFNRELNRIEKAIAALASIGEARIVKGIREKSKECHCKVCHKKFMAGRKDAQYCKNPCMPPGTAANSSIKKPVTLLKGDALSQK